MALTHAKAKEEAVAIQLLCEQVRQLQSAIASALTHNSNQAIDWAAQSKPAYLDEDAAGNLNGLTYSRQAVANAIGSLDQVNKLLTNAAVSQGDHLGNLNQLARP
jgi:hypothetical protein